MYVCMYGNSIDQILLYFPYPGGTRVNMGIFSAATGLMLMNDDGVIHKIHNK